MPKRADDTADERLPHHAVAEPGAISRERLKVFLGYASGVGKSFRMFDEARRRRARGQDVVVGAVQPHRSPEIESLLARLEVIPPRIVGGALAIDVPAILRRKPGVCFIDGLAFRNPPGSRHAKRWEDVQDLVAAGITVVTSLNIQYIEEERERVETITGKHVTDTVPKSFLYGADEIVVVDAPEEAIASRAAAYGWEPAEAPVRLSALREIALLLTADVVEQQLDAYLETRGIDQYWGVHERILVCLTPRANGAGMIGRAREIAGRFHGELVAVYVQQPELSARDRAALAANLALARDAGAEVVMLDSEDFVESILEFARERRITQIFVGHSLRESWWSRVRGGPVDRLIRNAGGMDVRVFPH